VNFQVIPAVDIQQGRAVRLFEGDPDKETVYYDTPLEAATHWFDLGAQWLHLVDLDAALGRGSNRDAIRDIAQTLECHIEVGGGIRDMDTAKAWLEVVDRIVVSTVAVTQPQLVDELLATFGSERVVVSIDARGGLVAVKGWAETSQVAATELAKRIGEQGVTTMIYTDVTRDGTMKGIDPEPVSLMRRSFSGTLIAGGGVAGEADLDLYEGLELDGAIVGRALYEGKIRYPRTAGS
jgi:phosphoribosylformimino-5-aminoimidazole carboxamide ribotide isomerase